MPLNYRYDALFLAPDPNLVEMRFEPASPPTGPGADVREAIYNVVTSRGAVALLIGAVCAAPSRPAVVALEHLLSNTVGDDAFVDELKQFTGRMVRYVVEHLGGRFVRSRVKVNIESRYYSGSIYSFA